MEPIAVVGHVTIDRVITRGGERRQLGGPPTYVSLITNLLGVPLRVCTKVGGDFPQEYALELAARGVDVSYAVAPSAKTTRFVLDYTGPVRGLRVESVCVPIEAEDVEGLPDETILAPIIREIPSRTLSALRSRNLALDPQGFIRKWEPDGSINLYPWQDHGLLRRLSVFKASARELRLVAGDGGWSGLERIAKLGVKVAIETRGEEGSHILHGGRRIVAPAYRVGTVDSTGAGDAFIAGFFSEYASGGDVEWCVALGSAAASAVVETVGPRVKIGRIELIERAEKVLDGIERLA